MKRLLIFLVALVMVSCPRSRQPQVLGVCADPNNLPFSDRLGHGFENRIASILADELGARVEYTWWGQRRGIFRTLLKESRCDVVIGVPADLDLALTTRPYYRSSYVFVTRADRHIYLRSLNDPRLRSMKIGVQLLGDDGANTPPALALTRRGLAENISSSTVTGDSGQANPPASIIHAVERGALDVGLVWGPQAGAAARALNSPLALSVITADGEEGFSFDISIGVRKGNQELKSALEQALDRREADIDAVLREYGVPLTELRRPRAAR